MNPTPLRFAMIGTGGISRAHWKGFAARPDAAVLTVACDPNAAAFAAFVEHSGLKDLRTFADHREVIRAGGFDAAIITLPHHLHYPVAADFVAAGIPCLVEKPVTCGLDEARRLRDLAEKHRVIVASGQNRRFNRDATWIQRWAKADAANFGELRTFDLQSWQNVYSYTGGPERTSHWILDRATAGGGVVLSLSIHQIDFVRYAFGVDYAEVMAYGRFDAPFKSGAESCANALFRMSNGASGTLHAQYTAPRVPYCESLKAFGTQGSVAQHVATAGSGDYEGQYLYSSVGPGGTTEWMHQFTNFQQVPADEVADLDPWSFTNQLVRFAEAVQANCEPENSLRRNFNTLATIEALYASLRSGRPERVVGE